MPRHDGPDISHHNPVRDWDEVPQYRLFSTKATEGRSFRSPTFDENWEQMRRRGFEFRGCYHWIRSDSPMVDQVTNLAYAIDDHGGLRAGEFVQLDWETTPNIRPVTIDEVEDWLTLAQRRWPGRIIVYASDWVPGFTTWRGRHPSYPLWYANYNLSSKPTGGPAEVARWNADVWQWTSSAPIPGIADPTCDMNQVENWETLHRITDQIDETPIPPELTDMNISDYAVYTFTMEPGAYLVGPGGVVHLDAGYRDWLISRGARKYVSSNRDVLASYKRVARGL